ncbi:MAG: hypothetical protein HY698_03860 [Deltaproteobacteria bacterium]|nr:hypothetical protein [Deltaproteobacteria bacterium]
MRSLPALALALAALSVFGGASCTGHGELVIPGGGPSDATVGDRPAADAVITLADAPREDSPLEIADSDPPGADAAAPTADAATSTDSASLASDSGMDSAPPNSGSHDSAIDAPNPIGPDATPSDTTAPSWPPGSRLLTTYIGTESVSLAWNAAEDDTGVVEYLITLNGSPHASVSSAKRTLEVAGLAPGATYTLAVEARDTAGLASTGGPSLDVTTKSPPPAGEPPPPSPTVTTNLVEESRWLYEGPQAPQKDVEAGVIQPPRVAILHGKVSAREGTPIAGVTIRLLDHSELGRTSSDKDGLFEMAVNGGDIYTVVFELEGFLSAHRKVTTSWQRYSAVPDVVLVPLDENVTTVDLLSSELQVARGSVVQDEDGRRQATLLAPPGTTATMKLADGTSVPLTTLHVRATEYTVGESGPAAMPAPLPPSSGYTYAVELSVDEAADAGAITVEFDPPLPFYVDNFLGFPVGIPAPVGLYDRERATWVAEESGRVVKIIDVSSGVAQVDTLGFGTADNGVDLGMTERERRELASLYSVGTSLWRVTLPHFTPCDINLALVLKPDAIDPLSPQPDVEVGPSCSRERPGSIIFCEAQALGERLPIPGAPLDLVYQSDRTPGGSPDYRMTIPVIGSTVPASLMAVFVLVDVAGTRHSSGLFRPPPNTKYIFTWDGRDRRGRFLQGKQPVQVTLGYIYEAVYARTTRFAGPGTTVLPNEGRQQITLLRTWGGTIGSWNAHFLGLGGFSASIHHSYDPATKTLYFGDGRVRSGAAAKETTIVEALTGDEGQFLPLDGMLAKKVYMAPLGIAVAPDGTIYFGDATYKQVYTIDTSGVLHTFAGKPWTSVKYGAPATESGLLYPEHIALAPDGTLYVADSYAVDKITQGGILRRVASAPFERCGGPSVIVDLSEIDAIATGPDGSLYIVDGGCGKLRHVDRDGNMTTIAGTGVLSSTGDGGPAQGATLDWPSDVVVAPDGTLFVVDKSGIRKIRPEDGIITKFSDKKGNLELGLYGTMYLCDGISVSELTPSGVLGKVAGVDWSAYNSWGDGGPALAAGFSQIRSFAVGPDGFLTIADNHSYNQGYRHVRRVRPSMPGYGFTAGNLLIPSEDGRQVFLFSADGRHLRTHDGLTNAVLFEFGYNRAGQLVSVTDDNGRVTRFLRDGKGALSQVESPFAHRTSVVIESDNLKSLTYPTGETISMTYAERGLLASLTDPLGNVHRFEYAADGRLVSNSRPDGESTTLIGSRRPDSSTVTVTTPAGRVTRYDTSATSAERRSRVTDAAGFQEETTSTGDGNVTRLLPGGEKITAAPKPDPRWGMLAPVMGKSTYVTPSGRTAVLEVTREAELENAQNPLSVVRLVEKVGMSGRVATATYDALARTLTRTSPTGRSVTETHDARGRLVKVESPGLLPFELSYNSDGFLESITQGQRVVEYRYGPQGLLESIALPMGGVTRYSYDANGRRTGLVRPDGEVISWKYDAGGRLASITPPGRARHSFRHSVLDLPEAHAPPVVGTEQLTKYRYHADGMLTEAQRSDGTLVSYEYDTAGRPKTVTLAEDTIAFGFDKATNQLASISSNDADLSYTYDGALVTGITWSGSVAGSVTRQYDQALRLGAIRVQGTEVPFTLDDDDLVVQGGALALVRDPDSGFVRATRLGKVSDHRDWNGYGELELVETRFEGTPVLTLSYVQDAMGRIAEVTESLGGITTTIKHGYDAAGRLETVTRNGVLATSYQYDPNGNRLRRSSLDGTTTAKYDEQDRLVENGTKTYEHDADGQVVGVTDLASGKRTVLAYDELGNLRGVDLPSGIRVSYLVDGQGRRIGRAVDGALVAGFLYEDVLRPAAELDALGNVVSVFVYASRGLVPDTMVKNGISYRFVVDHVGSPRLIVNSETGEIVQRMDYDEFGRVLLDTSPGFQPFGFAGGIYDPLTGFVRFGSRDYDAETGRFMARDPLLFAAGDANLYRYAFGDPVNQIDPTGELGIVGLAVGGGIAGAALGGVAYAATATATGQFTWRGLGAAMVGGAVAGAIAGTLAPLLMFPPIYANPIALELGAGAVSNLAGAAVQELLDPSGSCGKFSWGNVLLNGALGTVGGFMGGRMFPVRGIRTKEDFLRNAPQDWRGVVPTSLGGRSSAMTSDMLYRGNGAGAGVNGLGALGVQGGRNFFYRSKE